MLNFGKLAKIKGGAAPSTLSELFDQLDRKATHQILRPVQQEALAGLDYQQDKRDIVLKVSTGSGKTLVGLVYAEMMRRKYPGEPSVFLCPTSQLIDQVLDTAGKIGVSAETFHKGVLPHRAFEGKSVLVCTYDRLFTARNAFETNNVIPASIVLDDVHSGIDRVRQKYTVTVPAGAYDQIRAIFQPISEQCDPAIWSGICKNDSGSRFEVPYWIWIPQSGNVLKLLGNYSEEDELAFSWPNVSRYIEYARLCISGTGAELSLAVAASEENRAYSGAKRRLFMSASIKDGAALIRDLGCEEDALDRVIEPPSDRGAGERMILPVTLIDPALKKPDIAVLCRELSKQANVVVLTSSNAQSAVWAAHGATAKTGREVDASVALLRGTTKGNFFAFAQRFDGVDLPDDACRILVVDGEPTGERLCDQIDSERQKDSPSNSTRVVNRLEQAIGRAVRSSADFAAVLLVGNDLASFVGRKDVNELLEPHTKEQIDLGKDIAEQLKAVEEKSLVAVAGAIGMLLDRDDRWKDAHRERMASVVRKPRAGHGLTVNEQTATAERAAWLSAKARNHQAAVTALQAALDRPGLHEVQKAELMFRMASYMYQMDQARAAAIYRSAFELNSKLPRPPQMPDRKFIKIREQTALVAELLQQFTSTNAAIAKVEEIRAKLAYAGSAETVEQGLHELGRLIGANSSRPEKETGRGPDVLWIFEGINYCLEAKSEKKAPIFKADAEQLLLSTKWCVDQAGLKPDEIVSVFATNSNTADRAEDISFGPRILTEAVSMSLVDSVVRLINGTSFDGPLFQDLPKIGQRLHAERLNGKDVLPRLEKFRI